MKVSLTVPASYIAVLKLFAADKDVRHCLNGVILEIGRKETRLVASNGAMLGCFRVESEQPDVDAPLTNIIIPNDLLKPIKPVGKVEITIGDPELKEQGGKKVPSNARPVTIASTAMSLRVSGTTLDAVYPDYRRVIPDEVSGEPAQFDTRYLAALAKAWSILHGAKSAPCVGIGYNGENAALISLGDDNFIGVLMPLRGMEPPKTCPSWIQDSLQKE
jgi:DNA polymerase-3 subunit beta